MKEEKYIKDKLSNYDSPMDMEAMWANLEEGLDKNKDEKPVFWLLRFGKKIFFTALILLVAIVAYSYYGWNLIPSKTITENTYSQSQSTTTPKAIIENTETTTTSEIKETKFTETTTDLSSNTNTTENNNLEQKERKFFNSANSSTTKSRTTTKNNAPAETILKKPTKTTAPVLKEQTKQPALAYQATTSNSTIPKATVSKTATNEIIVKKPALLNGLALLSNQQLVAYEKETQIMDLDMATGPLATIEVAKQHQEWRVNLAIAQNATLFEHTNINEDIVTYRSRNGETSTTNNWSYGLGIERKTKGVWLFGLGLNYINHGAIYSARDGGEGVEEGFDSVIYQDSQGNFLGEGEVPGERLTIRVKSFRQYKKLHSLQLPLSIGYEKNFNKLDLSLSVSPAINYFYSQSSGEVRETSALLNYELSTFKLSGQAKAQVGYKLNGPFRLIAAVELGRLLGKLNSIIEDGPDFRREVAQTKFTYGRVSTGLSYSF